MFKITIAVGAVGAPMFAGLFGLELGHTAFAWAAFIVGGAAALISARYHSGIVLGYSAANLEPTGSRSTFRGLPFSLLILSILKPREELT